MGPRRRARPSRPERPAGRSGRRARAGAGAGRGGAGDFRRSLKIPCLLKPLLSPRGCRGWGCITSAVSEQPCANEPIANEPFPNEGLAPGGSVSPPQPQATRIFLRLS